MALFDDHSVLARQIEEALEAMDSPRRDAGRRLLILAGSLALFVMFQLVNTSVSGPFAAGAHAALLRWTPVDGLDTSG